ncbi:glycosyltransferase family 4 protein [Microbacterium aerolatum]|uniref:glycosyltransferase family 4 protein n=1 Tax=Microbacterium aerolatum TaxID=153731 RepID=UPI00384FC51A
MTIASRGSESTPDICHVSSVHPWTDNRIYFRECESLSQAGYRVQLIAIESDVDVEPGQTKVVALPRVGRLRRLMTTVPKALFLAFRSGARVIHVHDPELVWAVPIGKLLRRKVVYDAHEDLPAQVINKPYIPRSLRSVSVIAARFIVSIAKHSAWTISATEAIAARFDPARSSIVHNYPPLRPEEETIPKREDIAVYIGGMSAIRGTPEMLESVRTDRFPASWRLEIAGSHAPDVARDVALAAEETRIVFHGQVPPIVARDLLLRARVGVVPFQDTAAHRDSLPTKMFEYFAAGLPVIVSNFDLWRDIIETRDCGLVVDQTSPSAIAEAIATYAEDPALWLRHSNNARATARAELNWGVEAITLVSAYRGLLAPRPTPSQ